MSHKITKKLSGSAIVINGPCVFAGLVVKVYDGEVTIRAFDNTDASGKELPPYRHTILSNGIWTMDLGKGVEVEIALYIEIVGDKHYYGVLTA